MVITRKIEAGMDGETVIITTVTVMTFDEYLREAHEVYALRVSMKGHPTGMRPPLIESSETES